MKKRKHKGKTIIFYETPKEDVDEPYYPINTEHNCKLYQKYRGLARQDNKLIFEGRLDDYAYYDMDKTILAALQCYETRIFCGRQGDSQFCYVSSPLSL